MPDNKSLTVTFSEDEVALLQSLFEVLIEGTGTYMMLRLPETIAEHRRLYELFTRMYNQMNSGAER